MSRRGRKRKTFAKRDKSGKLAKPTTTAERQEAARVSPTPEMARKKRAVDGGELVDPLNGVALTNPQREALAEYMRIRRAAGWGVKRITASYDDPVFGYQDDGFDEIERARQCEERYNRCDAALLACGPRVHRVVCNLFSFAAVMGSLNDLRIGADALAAHFRIDLRDAA